MEINKNNYEAYLLDLWEGNLSEDEKVMLHYFFEEHPELRSSGLDDGDTLNLLGDISITEPNITFDKAAITFDEINSKNHEFFFIAYNEGDLSMEEMIVVDDFLKENPSLNKKFAQFSKAKLSEETILYPNKEKLITGKTSVISIQTKRWFVGVAAASIAIMIWITIPTDSVQYKYTMAPSGDLKIEKNTPEAFKSDIKTPINNSIALLGSENKLEEQLSLSTSEREKDYQKYKVKSERLNKQSLEENSNTVAYRKLKLMTIEKIKANDLSNVIAAIIPAVETEAKTAVNKKVSEKEQIPTLLDLTAAYLQSKNILDDERKPYLKSILNNSFSKVNKSNEPILATHNESNTKATIFQFGGFKVERITKK
jgi:hypothetical protein